MTTVIAMLRGVNVGGHNKIKMEALRALFQSLGLIDPSTHIQSGNVIFGTKKRDLPALAERIQSGIEQTFNVRTEVILRTADELRDAIARNPFVGREVPPDKLLINFLAHDPSPEARDNIGKLSPAPDEFVLDGRELYIYYANGVSGAKLPQATIDRALLKAPLTGRNWNTVTKLLSIAESQFAR